MISLPSQRSLDNPYLKDAAYTILFGVLSGVLSEVGVGDINLREIPLLICLFHLRNPLFIIVLSLFTLINSPSEVPYWAVYIVHLLPLFVAWVAFRQLERKILPNILFGVTSMCITIAYYLFLLLPLVVMALQMVSNGDETFVESYMSILPASGFEIIATSLVTGFYLMQFEIRKALEHSNKNLEQMVERRTIELTAANNELQSLNEELKASNDGIKELNESLEQMVKERTDKINDQLSQLTKYAHMNSHELRAPLARMLGLLLLIKREDNVDQKKELLSMLYDSSTELDHVIKEMNRLLEKEIRFYQE
ncbi:MAG: hypothetical protein HYR67_08275 [Bacteroidetes bacterium]|nr:hypothetical protein [Bacteroidota bacterium]